MDSVETQVRKLIIDVLDVDEAQVVDAATIREDLGADSLDIVQLIVAFSNLFDIEIDEDEVRRIQTFGDITAYIACRAHSFSPTYPTTAIVPKSGKRSPGLGTVLRYK